MAISTCGAAHAQIVERVASRATGRTISRAATRFPALYRDVLSRFQDGDSTGADAMETGRKQDSPSGMEGSPRSLSRL